MYGCLMVIISALVAGAVGPANGSGVSYTVDRIVDIPEPAAFTGRLRDYVQPTKVRFSIRLRDVEAPTDPNVAAAARRFLTARLANARQVKLRNVEDHGYFRLTAEVFVDGRNIAAEMLECGLVQPVLVLPSPPPDRTEAIWRIDPPSGVVPKPPVVSAELSDKALHQQLRLCADLSRIEPETSFQEALAILAGAVEPRLPLLVLWNDIERNALIHRDTPIAVEGFGRMRLDKALALILRAASGTGPRLIAVVEGGILTIATEQAGMARPRTEAYPVTDILAAPAAERREQASGTGMTPQ